MLVGVMVFQLAERLVENEQPRFPSHGVLLLESLPVPSSSRGLYVLAAGAKDWQQPHERDEVYYVLCGRAVIQVGDQTLPVKSGSVIYVKAGVEHEFRDIEEVLATVVFDLRGRRDQAPSSPAGAVGGSKSGTRHLANVAYVPPIRAIS